MQIMQYRACFFVRCCYCRIRGTGLLVAAMDNMDGMDGMGLFLPPKKILFAVSRTIKKRHSF